MTNQGLCPLKDRLFTSTIKTFKHVGFGGSWYPKWGPILQVLQKKKRERNLQGVHCTVRIGPFKLWEQAAGYNYEVDGLLFDS